MSGSGSEKSEAKVVAAPAPESQVKTSADPAPVAPSPDGAPKTVSARGRLVDSHLVTLRRTMSSCPNQLTNANEGPCVKLTGTGVAKLNKAWALFNGGHIDDDANACRFTAITNKVRNLFSALFIRYFHLFHAGHYSIFSSFSCRSQMSTLTSCATSQ